MIKHTIVFIGLVLVTQYGKGQVWKDLQKEVEKQITTTSLTEEDAVAGIKEALIKGTTNGVDILSVKDGYFGNKEVKIPFPEDAKHIAQKLRAMGMDQQVNNVILKINRAAEKASDEAKPIFVSAVKRMTVKDALNIVKGEENAATQYLRKTTYTDLFNAFKPIIGQSLQEVEATKYWTDLISTYNKIPFVQKANPDLEEYVTKEAINGLFVMIAKEELKIRQDPAARTTEILQKVFGN